jgi:proline dehydrogenase
VINFDDTAVAFKCKSNNELIRSYWLFKIIGSEKLVKIGKTLTLFALKIKLPIKSIIRATIFKQFCGGETVDQCTPTIKNLADYNVGTILDYSIEGKVTDQDFDLTVLEIIKTIDKGKNNSSIPFAVFKVSGIARFNDLECLSIAIEKNETIDADIESVIINRIDKICNAAYQNNIPVFIDAEETWIQACLDNWCLQMMLRYNKERAIVFNTLQMYRQDRLAFLKNCHELAITHNIKYGIKLVRGAYMEKERERAITMNYPSPIQATKEATDKDFNLAMEYIVDNINSFSLCAGTHNEESSLLLTQLMTKFKLPSSTPSIYFAQLLGMSDHISFNLADAGYNVAKYVPFGPIEEVMPYLLRRANENTSVAGQTSRELKLIQQERKRRRFSEE